MTSRERLLAVLRGEPPDHVPLLTWCFGFPAPASLGWETDGSAVSHWYSKRLEHIQMIEAWKECH